MILINYILNKKIYIYLNTIISNRSIIKGKMTDTRQVRAIVFNKARYAIDHGCFWLIVVVKLCHTTLDVMTECKRRIRIQFNLTYIYILLVEFYCWIFILFVGLHFMYNLLYINYSVKLKNKTTFINVFFTFHFIN